MVDYILLSAAQRASDSDLGLLPVPFAALVLDGDRRCFPQHMTPETFQRGPWFDSAQWPVIDDARWAQTVHSCFGASPRA